MAASRFRRAETLPAFEHRLSHVHMTILPSLAATAEPAQVKCNDQLGWFDGYSESSSRSKFPVALDEKTGSVNDRARAWLHVNCAQKDESATAAEAEMWCKFVLFADSSSTLSTKEESKIFLS